MNSFFADMPACNFHHVFNDYGTPYVVRCVCLYAQCCSARPLFVIVRFYMLSDSDANGEVTTYSLLSDWKGSQNLTVQLHSRLLLVDPYFHSIETI